MSSHSRRAPPPVKSSPTPHVGGHWHSGESAESNGASQKRIDLDGTPHKRRSLGNHREELVRSSKPRACPARYLREAPNPETPKSRSQARYVAWCSKYLTPAFTRPVGPSKELYVFLGGADCYALRCAVLHEGSDDITGQAAKDALESFAFTTPTGTGLPVHLNQVDSKLQIQVDIFCEAVCRGVDQWRRDIAHDSDVQARVTQLMKIQPVFEAF